MAIDLKNLTIKKAHEAFKRGEFSATDLAKAYLSNIEKKNKELNAYLEVYDDVLVQAGFADKAIATANKSGKDFPMLLGIPIAVKDNILVKGKTASSASKMLENYTATYDAAVIKKLQREHGMVLLGRTNMDEFALGSSTEKSAFGPTKNPHDTDRVPGGTSGGSATAVSADMALCALGSDTGGSIRQPASFCGVVGLKPTYGAVSRYGLMAAVSSFDQIGPLAKNIEDAEILFNAIKGRDAMDSTTIDEIGSATTDTSFDEAPAGERLGRTEFSAENSGAKRKKVSAEAQNNKKTIGIPRAFLSMGGIDPAVMEVMSASENKLKDKGYKIKDIDLPSNSYALPVYYILNFAEVSSNMARFDGVKYGLHADGEDVIDDYFKTRAAGFGPEVRRRILLGAYVLSSGYYDAYYNRANAVRRLIAEDFAEAFESVDIVMTPTAPSPAFKIGEKASDPVAMYLEDIFTVTANLVGMPAISVPAGTADIDGKALPVGIQLSARHGDEASLFAAGKDIEINHG